MILITIKRILGYILLAAGAIGVVFGILGIYQTWRMKAAMEANLLLFLSSTRETLEISSTGATNINDTLDTVDENITALNNTLLTVGQSLNDVIPILDDTAKLLKEDLPETFEATQTSLETAQGSAQLLDSVTRTITNIPFYPGEPYNPEVPLHVSLQNVATSLENIPESLSGIGTDMEKNRENLTTLEDNLISLSLTLTGISTDIQNSKTTVESYQTLMTSTFTRIDELELSIPVTLQSLAWFLTLLIVWLIFIQIGLIFQGIYLAEINLMRSNKEPDIG